MEALLLNEFSLTGFLVGLVTSLLGIYSLKVLHVFWTHYAKMIKAVKNIPGRPTIPLLGNAWEFANDYEESFNILIKMAEEFSFFRVWLGPKLIVATTRPSDYQIALSSPQTTQKAFFYQFMEPILINTLINGHGPKMRANRKMFVPIINGKYLTNYMEVFNKQLRRKINDMAKKLNMDEFDIYKESEHCVADIIYETMIGIPGTVQDTGDMTIPEAVDSGLEIFYQRCITPWLHPQFFFNLSRIGKKFKNIDKICHEFLYSIISQKKQLYMALARGDLNVKKPNPSLLDLIIENVVKTNVMDDDEIRYNIIDVFIGSYDSILGTFSFAMVMLAMHHEVQEKVREEVMAVVGPDADVLDEHIKKLTYTEMVINEIIRLFPIGPLLTREVTDDIEIDGHLVPKGSTFLMLPFVTHRSMEYWDEPNKFIPERFLPENSKNRHPYAYLPFSAGSRRCAGTKFAKACLKVMIVHCIRNYQFTTTMTLESIKLKTHISVRSSNGYKVSIKKFDQL
ncbi:hypothetical protein PV327_006527 [Microctonus hyperodae]|uniref:Cytochrome P450 n=1 Tax=Microctonus hyperodae TaxID=165561 RepID=A0AA39F4K6_MICHY|nr:hypothetical protein PV327_006527 [Microctonus hyperodae]